MKLVMIHGIAQEGSTEDELHETWKKLIADAQPGLLDGVDVQMAYYGKELASWTTTGASAAVAMGVAAAAFDPAKDAEMNFLISALQQAAVERGVSDAQIDDQIHAAQLLNGSEAVPMSTWLGKRLVGLVRALEAISPLKGALALRVIKQAYTYLDNPKARDAVDRLVRPRLTGDKLVIVSHSLGTVVAFRLLREMAQKGETLNVPLFVTLGSPLGLDAFKAKLGPPRQKPPFVERWVNFYDPGDFVTLGKDLDTATFAASIENVGDVDNDTDNAHGISGYLPEGRVIAALKATIN